MTAVSGTRIETTLPSGGVATLVIEFDTIGVRTDDRYCVAHHRWMTRGQLTELGRVVEGLLR